MQKPSRLILWTLGGGAILFVVFVLAVNLYVQSDGMRKKLQMRLGAALGLPVKVFRASYTPWGGFHLSKVACSNAGAGKDTFLTTDDLNVHTDWLPLLRGEVVISKVVLEKTNLTLRQDETDSWNWPDHRASVADSSSNAPTAVAGTPALHGAPTTPAAASPVSPASELAWAADKNPVQALPVLRKFLLKEGKLQLIDRHGSEILRLENVRLSVESGNAASSFHGKLQIRRILLRQRWEITGFSSPATFQHGELVLGKMEGDWADGRVSGNLTLQTAQSDFPFALNLRLAKLFLPALCSPDSDLREQLGGQLSGDLKLTGLAGRSRRNEGSAALKITGGEFKQYPLLQTIGSFLRSDELSSIQLKKAETRLTILNSALEISNCDLASQNLRLTATGDVQPDLGLDLRCSLFLNEATFKKLPSEARENFTAVPASKERSLDFQVYGRVDQPGTDLLKRLVGSRLQRKLHDVLGLFGQPPEPVLPETLPSTDGPSPSP